MATLGKLDSVIRAEGLLCESLDKHFATVRWIATALEKENKTSKVEQLEQALLKAIEFQSEMKLHRTALQQVKQSYAFVPGVEIDFRSHIDDATRQLASETATVPEDHEQYRKFRKEVWDVHHAGEAMPGQEDDEIVMTEEGGLHLLNATCPMTAKPIADLQSPLRSSVCQHIYDRESILAYIRSRMRVPCPVAGCRNNHLQGDQLFADHTLKVDIERMRHQQTDAATQRVDLDCADVDEEDSEAEDDDGDNDSDNDDSDESNSCGLK